MHSQGAGLRVLAKCQTFRWSALSPYEMGRETGKAVKSYTPRTITGCSQRIWRHKRGNNPPAWELIFKFQVWRAVYIRRDIRLWGNSRNYYKIVGIFWKGLVGSKEFRNKRDFGAADCARDLHCCERCTTSALKLRRVWIVGFDPQRNRKRRHLGW